MQNLSIRINDDVISEYSPPYIIAEMSANHNGSLENALALIEQAKLCGANAVKLQTYTADTMTLNSSNPDFMIRDGLWAGQNLYALYESAYTPWEWHPVMFEKAKELGISIFSSPFDRTAVDFLEDLGAPAYKIASFEAIDHPLIEYAASTGKPMIISTGMADQDEIKEAIDVARQAGCNELAVLHCVSGYPAPPSDYNLKTIADLESRFGVLAGLSDHTLSNTTALASVALGARIVEKHFTLDRNAGGVDDSFSIQPEQLSALVRDCKEAWEAIGSVHYSKKDSEKENSKYRRSLYFVDNLRAGTVISNEHVRSIRPGFGLAPKELKKVIGKKLCVDVAGATPVKWECFE